MIVPNSKIRKKEITLFIQKLRAYLLDLPKSLKIIISILVDSFLCFITTWLSFYLRLGELFPNQNDFISPLFISY